MSTSPRKSLQEMVHDIFRSARIRLKINKDGFELSADTVLGIVAAVLIIALLVWSGWPTTRETKIVNETISTMVVTPESIAVTSKLTR